ncbi:MAG: Eco57I restriction-modification methylase domain-containing protein, partial [Chloroflexota bacterium]|nr:Eco57I restriction-modification methylase domain-containing protein [Chloroflexota bacterium]
MAPAGGLPLVVCDQELVERLDLVRLDATRHLRPERRTELGQYLTAGPVARLMASLFLADRRRLRVLDAGAGIGSLAAALVAELCGREERPEEITVTAYEVDGELLPYLSDTLNRCAAACDRVGVHFSSEIRQEDFIEAGVAMLRGGWFAPGRRAFDCAILNPPYRKIHGASRERHLLRSVGVETSNLYTAFLALVVRLLDPSGELVAITPRSFCNGPYFRPFREEFLREMALRRLHVFASRRSTFRDDDVLQENVILHAVKDQAARAAVLVTESDGADDEAMSVREVAYDQLVRPDDPQRFIHLVPDALSHAVADRMAGLPAALADLGLSVSTGRVVDFRANAFLRAEPAEDTAPLIYPTHFGDGFVAWPKQTRKPNALVLSPESEDLLVPEGVYVLVKRFSAKEEARRVVAAVYHPTRVAPGPVGFENHLNYFHHAGQGLALALATGLAAFLNSSLVDEFFRQFSGHTQVNATDLRALRYPSLPDLERLGHRIGEAFPQQEELDRLVEEELVANDVSGHRDPIAAKRRIDQALAILKAVGLPRAQQNERSALTLLALLDLRPEAPWVEASAPPRGITPIMEFMAAHYGKTYAPNTRETVRRFTVHQFRQAALVVANPDEPTRPTNSPKAVYQVEPTFLELVRTYGTDVWEGKLLHYLTSVETLQKRYASERLMERIPVALADGTTFTLSPGGQNVLVQQVIAEFCPRFTPGSVVLYVGDTAEKFAHFDRNGLEALGVRIEEHGKLPDVIV